MFATERQFNSPLLVYFEEEYSVQGICYKDTNVKGTGLNFNCIQK